MSKQIGKIAQVIGPVIDVRFDLEGGKLPNIMDALEIMSGGKKIILEVATKAVASYAESHPRPSSVNLGQACKMIKKTRPTLSKLIASGLWHKLDVYFDERG